MPALAEQPAAGGPEPQAGARLDCDWFDREQANLLAAADQASTAGAHTQAVELAIRIAARQCTRGGYAEAIKLWRVVADRAEAADDLTAARAKYFLAAVIAGSHDRTNLAAALLADCVPRLEQVEDLESAAYGHCLLGRYASMDHRHAGAIRSARRAAQLAGDGTRGRLVRCCALTLLGITLARMGMVEGGARYCQRARADAHTLAEPVYEAHAAQALAQVLILRGDYRWAIDVCEEGIGLARGYGGTVDVARLELVAGRARQCNRDYAEATVSLRAAADVFRDADLMLDQVTAGSMLAACCRLAGRGPSADAYLAEVSGVLARGDVADAESVAAAAEQTCDLSRNDEAPTPSIGVRSI
jgi:tetratricopeptide (TPR) repeat protein